MGRECDGGARGLVPQAVGRQLSCTVRLPYRICHEDNEGVKQPEFVYTRGSRTRLEHIE